MDELEKKYKAITKKLRPYKILTYVGCALLLVAIVFLIINLANKNQTTEILSYVGIGLSGFVFIFFLALYFIYKKDLKECKKIKDDILAAKKKL